MMIANFFNEMIAGQRAHWSMSRKGLKAAEELNELIYKSSIRIVNITAENNEHT